MDQDKLESARTAAFFYGLFVLLLMMIMVIGTLSGGDASIWRIIGHLGLALLVPWIPMLGLLCGRKFATTDGDRRVLSLAIFAAVGLPALALAAILASSEPLAALALLYVPPLQAAGLGLVVLFLGLNRLVRQRRAGRITRPADASRDRAES